MTILLHDATENRVLAVEPAAGTPLTMRLSLPATASASPLWWLRPLVIGDVLLRRLRAHGLDVSYVRDVACAPSTEQAALGADVHADAVEPQVREESAPLSLLAPDCTTRSPVRAAGVELGLDFSSASTQAPLHHQLQLSTCELRLDRPGNPLDAHELYRWFEPEALRYFALATHHRTPVFLTLNLGAGGAIECVALDEAERRVEYVHRTRARLDAIPAARTVESPEVAEEIETFAARLDSALDDDLNTPEALAIAADLLKHVNDLAERAKSKKTAVGRTAVRAAREAMDRVTRSLGLGASQGEELLGRIRARRCARLGIDEAEVQRLISARVAARSARDFSRADSIRQEITQRGIELVDGPEGTHWRIP